MQKVILINVEKDSDVLAIMSKDISINHLGTKINKLCPGTFVETLNAFDLGPKMLIVGVKTLDDSDLRLRINFSVENNVIDGYRAYMMESTAQVQEWCDILDAVISDTRTNDPAEYVIMDDGEVITVNNVEKDPYLPLSKLIDKEMKHIDGLVEGVLCEVEVPDHRYDPVLDLVLIVQMLYKDKDLQDTEFDKVMLLKLLKSFFSWFEDIRVESIDPVVTLLECKDQFNIQQLSALFELMLSVGSDRMVEFMDAIETYVDSDVVRGIDYDRNN